MDLKKKNKWKWHFLNLHEIQLKWAFNAVVNRPGMLMLFTKPSETSVSAAPRCYTCNVSLILVFADVSEHVVCVVTAFRQNRHQRVSGWLKKTQRMSTLYLLAAVFVWRSNSRHQDTERNHTHYCTTTVIFLFMSLVGRSPANASVCLCFVVSR